MGRTGPYRRGFRRTTALAWLETQAGYYHCRPVAQFHRRRYFESKSLLQISAQPVKSCDPPNRLRCDFRTPFRQAVERPECAFPWRIRCDRLERDTELVPRRVEPR